MNSNEQQELTVKAFVRQRWVRGEQNIQIDVVKIPIHDMDQAKELWELLMRVHAVDAAYIYRGDRIFSSWDQHANYLVAINDIDESQYYAYNTYLTDDERAQLMEEQP